MNAGEVPEEEQDSDQAEPDDEGKRRTKVDAPLEQRVDCEQPANRESNRQTPGHDWAERPPTHVGYKDRDVGNRDPGQYQLPPPERVVSN